MPSVDEVTPIPAASVLLLRDGPLQVLMMRRHEKSSFVPNVWVFPGGAVEETDRASSDGTLLGTMLMAGARETFEETGIWLGDERRRFPSGTSLQELTRDAPLDPERLVWTSHWITPVGVPMRFDTWFFLARAGPGAIPPVANREAVDIRWIEPAEALARHQREEFPLVFPTVKNLEAIHGFTAAEELMASRRGADIQPIQPRLVIEDDKMRIVLP